MLILSCGMKGIYHHAAYGVLDHIHVDLSISGTIFPWHCQLNLGLACSWGSVCQPQVKLTIPPFPSFQQCWDLT